MTVRKFIALTTLIAPSALAATFPVEPGEAVVTCSNFQVMQPLPGPYVLGVIDIREPECDPLAQLGQNWPAPMYHNEMPNPTMNPADEWTYLNLGQVFGIALDDLDPPNIYVTSTSLYQTPTPMGDGRVHRIDRITGAISLFQTLPNLDEGLGNIAFDPSHRQLFVTNHSDGKIYRLDLSGTVLDAFDPFGPDDGLPGFCPLGERLWGVGVYGQRVYFAVWWEDEGQPDGIRSNEVWSVAIDATGALVPSDVTLEVTMPWVFPPPAPLWSNPVSDIAFAPDGRMMLAERSMRGESTWAHASRIFEYRGGHLAWVPSGASFEVGDPLVPTSSAGGVDYDCFNLGSCSTIPRVWASGDALQIGAINTYGIAGFPEAGGNVASSYLVDFDGDLGTQGKFAIGDVEIRRICPIGSCPDGPICVARPPAADCIGNAIVLDATFSSPCPGFGLEYRWLAGAVVRCDWSPSPICIDNPTAPTLYTLEVRCLDPARVCTDSLTFTVTPLPTPIADLQIEPRICSGGAITLDATGSSAPGCTTGLEYQFSEGATILSSWGPSPTYGPLSPTVTTTYTVEVRCGSCVDQDVREVIVTPMPVPRITALTPSCAGDRVLLDAGTSSGCGPAGIEYEWRQGATIVCSWSALPTCDAAPGASTSYDLFVRCLDNPDCTATTSVPVVVVPRPIAVAGTDVSVCESAPVSLDASASTTASCPSGALYEWWSGATLMRAASPVASWSPPTTSAGTTVYTVVVTCAGLPGCADSDDVVVEVRVCTLAVHFDSVAARRKGAGVEVAWTTTSEMETNLFVVERRSEPDGAFIQIGDVVPARGPGYRYGLIDSAPPSRVAIYRVVEYTFSGRGDVSPVVTPLDGSAAGGRRRRR